MKKWFIPALSLAFFLSRIPFLNMGFGSDIDSWVYADTGFAIFKTGKYFASRGIGFPLYEFLIALILKVDEAIFSHDWILTNTLSMITTFACIIVLYKILTKWGIAHKELLLLGFTFMPVIWKNSTNTMDYMISLMFILFSHYLIIEKNYSLGAIALGFAVGARPTNGIILFPFFYLIWKEERKEIIKFSAIFSLIAISFFIPFLCTYKILTLEEYRNYMYPPSTFVMNLSKIGYRIFYEFIGLDAAIFLLILISFSKNGLKKFFQVVKQGDKVVIFSIVTMTVFLALFIKYPFQPEYLIPLIPSSLILTGIFFKKRNLIILLFLIILNGFLIVPGINFNFNTKGDMKISPEFIKKGTLISDMEERKKFLEFREILPQIDLNDHSIVIWHEYQAPYVYYNRYKIFKEGEYFDSTRHLTCLDYIYIPDNDVYMTYLFPEKLIKDMGNYNIYYLPCVVRLVRRRSNIDLLKYNPNLLNQLKSMDY